MFLFHWDWVTGEYGQHVLVGIDRPVQDPAAHPGDGGADHDSGLPDQSTWAAKEQRMRGLTTRSRLAVAVAAIAGAALISTATPAAAAPILNVNGGKTTTVSDPALGPALIGAGILPLPVS